MEGKSRASAPGSASRLFFAFAVVSLVPVLLLGLVLAASYRSSASSRGLSEARAQAHLFARTSVESRLAGADLHHPLSASTIADLDKMSRSAVVAGDIVRFRIRSLNGHVIYSNDRSRSEDTDEEALDAAKGETIAEITHLNADNNGDGAIERGIRVAEVYTPLTNGRSARPTGVLELYLPYDPIAQDIGVALRSLYRDLSIGLLLLYVVLAGISWSVTSRLRRLAARNGYLATYDQLTGLPNRAAFQAQLETTLAHATSRRRDTVITILNLDRFQEVNDTLGHSNGDTLLIEVGRRLGLTVGPGDVLARLGGDEFAVIWESADPAVVDAQVEAILEAVRPRLDLAGIPIEVEATVGMARAPRDGTEAETLLQHADVATAVAKQRGARLGRYHAASDPYDPQRLALVSDLRRAINEDELVLHYQPKIDVRTGAVDTAEALLRWNHPERGLLMPDEFLPVVEQTQMIEPLTEWVLDAALSWVTRARLLTPTMRIAVNVSARNLNQPEFATQVMEALTRHRCAADCLAVEVTETALVADPQRADAALRRLAATGVRISVDDFGRGQTSLSQLATMPLDEVKIDKSFVLDMCRVSAHASIVQSITDLAHRLGFQVAAEGVEHQQILDALRQVGCDIAQGYHVARPMPDGALERWLAVYDKARFRPTPGAGVPTTAVPVAAPSSGKHRRAAEPGAEPALADVGEIPAANPTPAETVGVPSRREWWV